MFKLDTYTNVSTDKMSTDKDEYVTTRDRHGP